MNLDQAYRRLGMKIFVDFGGTLAVPAVLAALAGDWLDERYHTAPRYLVILLVLAFVLSAVSLVKKAKAYGKRYNALNDQTEKDV